MMTIKTRLGTWIIAAAAFASGCKHAKHDPQACLPKSDAVCATPDAKPRHQGPFETLKIPCMGGRRYFTPLPNCPKLNGECALPAPGKIMPHEAKPVSLPKPAAGERKLILPDDMPPSKVPSRVPDGKYHDVNIETAPPPTHAAPDAASVAPTLIAPPTIVERVETVEARAVDFSWLSGKLEYSNIKRQWRLRYAPPDCDDEHGGVMNLNGLENTSLSPREGANVQVRGQLVKSESKNAAPEYFVHEATWIEAK
jgi:hypothetical protein